MMRNLMICTFTQYSLGNQIEKDEMGRNVASSTFGRQQKCIEGFGGET